MFSITRAIVSARGVLPIEPSPRNVILQDESMSCYKVTTRAQSLRQLLYDERQLSYVIQEVKYLRAADKIHRPGENVSR